MASKALSFPCVPFVSFHWKSLAQETPCVEAGNLCPSSSFKADLQMVDTKHNLADPWHSCGGSSLMSSQPSASSFHRPYNVSVWTTSAQGSRHCLPSPCLESASFDMHQRGGIWLQCFSATSSTVVKISSMVHDILPSEAFLSRTSSLASS